MYKGGNQQFASPTEALAHISESAWGDYTKADYTIEQWHAACLIHIHDGAPTSKSQCKLPVKTPNGALNRNGVHAAAAALAGARGGLKGVSDEQRKTAGNALKRYYAQLDEDPSESLTEHSDFERRTKPGSPEDVLKHYGKKGMKWGVRNEDKPVGRDSGVTVPPKTEDRKNQEQKNQGQKQSTLSESKQRKVDEFLKRADVMDTRITELKVSNKALQGTRDLSKRYDLDVNTKAIQNLERTQKRALRDAEAVQKGKLTSTQKKVIFGAVAVTALLGAAAVYKTAPGVVSGAQESGALNSWKLLGQARLRGQKVPFNVNENLRKPMGASELLSKVVKPINPGYNTPGGKMNCRRATYVYELRRRGFDVHATTSWQGRGQSESGVLNALTPGSRNVYRAMSMSEGVATGGFSARASRDNRPLPGAVRAAKTFLDGLDTGGPDGMTEGYGSKKVFEFLGKEPNGSRGEVLFKFPNFGHSMAYEIVNGKPHVFDSQKGTYHDLTKTVEDKWGSFSGAEIRRLDNAPLDLKFLSRWATNVE